jgi:hypothetical protein
MAALLAAGLTLGACAGSPGAQINQQRAQSQARAIQAARQTQRLNDRRGQYVYPENQRPAPRLYGPAADQCGARLYAGLRGSHIGGIHLAVIGGDKRIIKPAALETGGDDFLQDMEAGGPRLEVKEMLAGQPLYGASVRTGLYLGQLGPERPDRLTLELDGEGYVINVACG